MVPIIERRMARVQDCRSSSLDANRHARTGQAEQRSRGSLGKVVEDLRLLGPVVDGSERCGSRGDGRESSLSESEHGCW